MTIEELEEYRKKLEEELDAIVLLSSFFFPVNMLKLRRFHTMP